MLVSVLQTILLGLFFVIPGGLLLFSLGVKRVAAFFLSPLITFALLGVLTLASAWFPWNPASVIFILLGVILLTAVLRFALQRKPWNRTIQHQLAALSNTRYTFVRKRMWFWIAVGFIGNAIAVIVLFVMPAPPLTLPIDNYDNPFHYAVIRHILETGCASPIGAGSVMGNAHAVYPDLSHAVVALIVSLWGIDISEALWLYAYAILLFVVPFGMNALTLILYKKCNGVTIVLSSLLASILPYSITYVMFNFGVLLANYLGMALLPIALFAAIGMLGDEKVALFGPQDVKKRLGCIALLGLASIVALGLAHPNTAILFAVLLLPFFLTLRLSKLKKLCIVGAYMAGWAIMFLSPLFSRTVNCLDRVGTTAPYGDAVMTLFNGADGNSLAGSSIVIGLSVLPFLISAVIAFCARHRWGQSWYLASLGIMCTQAAFTFFPHNIVAIVLTGFWYRDMARFVTLIFFLAVPVLAYLPQAIADAFGALAQKNIRGRKARLRHRVLAGMEYLTYGVTVCAVAALLLHAVPPHLGVIFTYTDMNDIRKESLELGEELPVLEEIASVVGDDVVLNGNNDNSVWLYGLYGTNALLKGHPANQVTSMPDDECTVLEGINKIGEATEEGIRVREAASKLGIRYVLKMGDMPPSTTRFNQNGSIDYQVVPALMQVSADTAGLHLIDSNRRYELYEVEWSALLSL